jgi:hypothetical protein
MQRNHGNKNNKKSVQGGGKRDDKWERKSEMSCAPLIATFLRRQVGGLRFKVCVSLVISKDYLKRLYSCRKSGI